MNRPEEIKENGVAKGTRTLDDRNHNPGLYQLSYSHHRTCKKWRLGRDDRNFKLRSIDYESSVEPSCLFHQGFKSLPRHFFKWRPGRDSNP